jgi:hypothetical protein
MLVVDSVVLGCPCDGVTETGDVLVEVNGQVRRCFGAWHGLTSGLCSVLEWLDKRMWNVVVRLC